MATISNGESGSSVRTKLNDIINKVEGVSDINNNLTVDGNFTVTGDFTVQGTTITVDSATAQTIVLGDNDKMTFGAGSDLQIYHSGSHSYIQDLGTGTLYIDGTDLTVRDANTAKVAISVQNNTDAPLVQLRYDNATKLATTSTGIDVTGQLDVNSVARIDSSGIVKSANGTEAAPTHSFLNDPDNGMFRPTTNTVGFSTAGTERLRINSDGSVYWKPDGTTQDMTLDASGNLLVGVTSTTLSGGSITLPNNGIIAFHDAGGSARNTLQFASGELKHGAAGAGLTAQTFYTNSSERMKIDSNGRVKLHEDLVQDEVKATTTATTQTAIDTFPHASYDGAKVVITAATSADTYVTELLIATNGTTAVATEYGQIGTGSALATYDVDISGANVRILATPASTTSTTFRVAMTLT